jgi:hypothetical protein
MIDTNIDILSMFTGICICGHSWDDHHHGAILNPKALQEAGEEFRNVDGNLGEECEYSQFEGIYTPEVDIYEGKKSPRHEHREPCHCDSYHDQGWPKEGKK